MGLNLCVLGWVRDGEPDVDLSCGAWGTEGSCEGRADADADAGEEADAEEADAEQGGRLAQMHCSLFLQESSFA